MHDYYVVSTFLHLFQAYHLSMHSLDRRAVYLIDKSVICPFVYLLPGRIVEFEVEDGYLKTLCSSCTVKKRELNGARLYFGNQVHSIVSTLITKYSFTEIYLMDDGLQYYGRGIENRNLIWFVKNIMIRDSINRIFSYFGLNVVSSRNYLNFSHLEIKPILISFMLDVDKKLSPCNEIDVLSFGKYFSVSRHEKISAIFFDKSIKFVFYSYVESSALFKAGVVEDRNILHPKFRSSQVDCPFEFAWASNFDVIKSDTSLYYVVQFIKAYYA